MSCELLHLLERQQAFSLEAFGPDDRRHGIVDHIRKELQEIEVAPWDAEEWADVALLSLDGAWRTGAELGAVVDAIGSFMGPWPPELDRPSAASCTDLVILLRQLRYESITRHRPEQRIPAICQAIRGHLDTITTSPDSPLCAWVAIFLLALDGAWRSTPYLSCVPDVLLAKLAKNEQRQWPDWRLMPANVAIEHLRT